MAAELGGAAVSGVASKVSESVFDSVGREISYVFKYRSYVQGLKKQVQDLTNAKERVEHSVDYARRQGEEVEKDVEQWLVKVNEFIEREGKSIIDDEETAKRWCLKGLCPNVVNHYLLSKKAVKARRDAVNLLEKGFDRVSYRCLPQRTESMYLKDFESFHSRMSKLDDIMGALKDANVNMIGVYGMGGVGKTTLVKKVAWLVTEEKLFDTVVVVDVTQTPNHQKIQEKISYDLGLELGQLSEFERVGRIRKRLKKEKKVLVILDNIWAKLDLEAIGIPCGDVEKGIAQEREDWKGRHDYEGQRKILLTSRSQDVLRNAMHTQMNFSIEILSDEEGNNFFGKMVGGLVENSAFQPIAVEIVRKCAGLPLAIIGELKRLETLSICDSDIEQLPEEIGQLTPLRFLCLWDCSKLKVIKPNVISNLSLLEELYLCNCFVQWDVEGKSNASLAELRQLSSLTTLYLDVHDAQIIPQDFAFEKLEGYAVSIGDIKKHSHKYDVSRTLKLKLNDIVYNLWYGIKDLVKRAEVLYLDEPNVFKNVLYELDGEGFPHLMHLHVENGSELLYIILSMEQGSCNAFPMLESLFLQKLINLEKICHGQLSKESFCKLRIIKVGECDKLKHLFSVSLATNLSQLQEIKVSYCKNIKEIFSKEDEDHVHQTEGNSTIHEFTKMRSLTLKCLPQLISFGFYMKTPLISKKSLATNTGSKEIVAEDDIGDFISLFSEKVMFPCLEKLTINIEMIWLNQLPAISFCSQALKSLTVEDCGSLKFLFSSSMVKSLMQLKNLSIRNCKSMEGVVIDIERLEGNILVFPKLFCLELKDLPKLTRFGTGNVKPAIVDCMKGKKASDDVAACMSCMSAWRTNTNLGESNASSCLFKLRVKRP